MSIDHKRALYNASLELTRSSPEGHEGHLLVGLPTLICVHRRWGTPEGRCHSVRPAGSVIRVRQNERRPDTTRHNDQPLIRPSANTPRIATIFFFTPFSPR